MGVGRDYRLEYLRRIERGMARGLDRSAARGHGAALRVESIQGGASPKFDPKLEAALKQLRQGNRSLTGIAKDAKVSRERLSRYIKGVAGAERDGRVWTFNDQRIRRMSIIAEGADHPIKVRVRGFEPAHVAGLHAYEAGQVLKNPSLYPTFKRRWENRRVKDVEGRWHTLSTDLNQHFEATLSHDYSFERFYKIET